jgi:hypothetical protein
LVGWGVLREFLELSLGTLSDNIYHYSNALSEAVADIGRTFGVKDIPSGGSLRSHMLALSGHMQSKLCEALHTGVKQALAVVASHYEIDLERVAEGYILPNGDELAEAKVRRLTDVIEGPGTMLACHFEEDVVLTWL